MSDHGLSRTNRSAEGRSVGASVILQELRNQAPASHVTLNWLLTNLHQHSFGIIILIFAIVAAAPGISVLAGLLLLVPAVQMVLGCAEPKFPNWIGTHELPIRQVDAVVRRAIPILAFLERAIYPRFSTPPGPTKRVVGAVTLMLTIRLLLVPFPMSNIVPALLIAFIAMAYLERDGLVLCAGVLIAGVHLMLELGMIEQLIHLAKSALGFV